MRVLPRSRTGFTLVEIMVALVLLVLGALAMASLSMALTQANRGSTSRTRASQSLTEKIEELRGVAYASVGNGADTVVVGDVTYTRSWTVTTNDPVADVKRVELTASWTDRDRTFETTTSTMIGLR